MNTVTLELMERYVDGMASAGDVAELDALLGKDPVASRDFLRLAMLHGQLSRIRLGEATPDFEAVFAEVRPVGRHQIWRFGRHAAAWFLAALATVGTVVAGVFFMMQAGPSPLPSEMIRPIPLAAAATPTLGVVRQTCLVAAKNLSQPIRAGDTVSPGRLAIEAGALEVELSNGVHVIIHGPAEVEFIDTMHGFLHAGSACVRVPKGMSGYRLDTASVEVLDLGTEFAVRAGPGLVTDVQVFDGAVVTTGRSSSPEGAFPRRLEAGQARRFRPGSRTDGAPIPYSASRFVRNMPSEIGMEHTDYRDPDEQARRFGRPRIDSLFVTRINRAPVIDGHLDDWPATSGFRATLRDTPHSAEWVDGRMAYDDEHLYIAARVGDPAPMRSGISPEIDSMIGWQGGGVQVRLSTDRTMGWPADANAPSYYRVRGLQPSSDELSKAANTKLTHLTMWYHAESARACLTINHGMEFTDWLTNPETASGCFRKHDDGAGYTLEYAIPWSLLNAAADPPRSGDVLAAHWQVHFSDPSGLIWRDQIVEIRNLHEIRRILSFERAATWGRAEFE